jgi:hypothetical protein
MAKDSSVLSMVAGAMVGAPYGAFAIVGCGPIVPARSYEQDRPNMAAVR